MSSSSRIVLSNAAARVLPPLVTLAVVLLIWDSVVRWKWVPSFLLPPPAKVAESLGRDWPELSSALAATAIASASGFLMSAVVGSLIAVGLASSKWVRRALYPYAVFFQTVPIVAIAPLLVIWAGHGMPTAFWSAFIVSIFPVIANTLVGLRSTDPALLDLFSLYGAGRLATLTKLRWPSALPNFIAGLRVAGGLAVIGSIVGEFIGGSGALGDVIIAALSQQRNAKVFASVLLASLLGLALFGVVNLLGWLVLRRWHASVRET